MRTATGIRSQVILGARVVPTPETRRARTRAVIQVIRQRAIRPLVRSLAIRQLRARRAPRGDRIRRR
jgi:hypothetical protein